MRKLGPRRILLGLSVGISMLGCLVDHAIGDDSVWHPGMTAIFAGFLCKQPVDAVHGLIAALDLRDNAAIEDFEKVETPQHCFYSDGPLRFLGRVVNSKVFVDPQRGRFVFVEFDIGGSVTAYSWIAEAFVSEVPEPAAPSANV